MKLGPRKDVDRRGKPAEWHSGALRSPEGIEARREYFRLRQRSRRAAARQTKAAA